MPSPNPGRERVLLGLLHSVEQDGTRSQRNMATEFGVALGLINTCLRHCVRKGYVKVKRIPARRYAYFLTPKGMAEKSRLTVVHLSNSLSFFRQAREDCDKVLRIAENRGWSRLVLAGAGDLAEIAFLCSDPKTTLVAILDPACAKDNFHGLTVARDMDALPPFDAVIVTDMSNPQSTYDRLGLRLTADRILPLDVLRITTPPTRLAG
jgi:hypothetical protein